MKAFGQCSPCHRGKGVTLIIVSKNLHPMEVTNFPQKLISYLTIYDPAYQIPIRGFWRSQNQFLELKPRVESHAYWVLIYHLDFD